MAIESPVENAPGAGCIASDPVVALPVLIVTSATPATSPAFGPKAVTAPRFDTQAKNTRRSSGLTTSPAGKFVAMIWPHGCGTWTGALHGDFSRPAASSDSESAS